MTVKECILWTFNSVSSVNDVCISFMGFFLDKIIYRFGNKWASDFSSVESHSHDYLLSSRSCCPGNNNLFIYQNHGQGYLSSILFDLYLTSFWPYFVPWIRQSENIFLKHLRFRPVCPVYLTSKEMVETKVTFQSDGHTMALQHDPLHWNWGRYILYFEPL